MRTAPNGGVLRLACWTLVLGCVLCNAGCMTAQLRDRMTDQAGSIPDVYYQVVLDNLAMIKSDPARMPYFSDPQTARTRIQQSATVGGGLEWDLVTTAPTGVLTLFNRFLLGRDSLSLNGGQSNSAEWTALTANDPDKLFTMRAAYRRVVGVASAEDDEILSEFYYRHFEITDDALNNLRDSRPDVYEKVGSRLAKLNGIEYLSAEGFEERLKAADVIGRDDFERYRRTLLKTFRMVHEPTEFVSDADTHHLLYISALRPGWFGTGQKEDVPTTAAYAGRYGKTFVWVMPDETETLTRLALAVLDIHTFKSERIGGSRVQPGILPK